LIPKRVKFFKTLNMARTRPHPTVSMPIEQRLYLRRLEIEPDGIVLARSLRRRLS